MSYYDESRYSFNNNNNNNNNRRSQSVSRESSVNPYSSFNTRSQSQHTSARRRYHEREMLENESKLEQANKDYHDMHATFTAKRLSNRHHLHGIQDTVVDQTLQLNRILRLLNEDDYLSYDLKHLGVGHSTRTSYVPKFNTHQSGTTTHGHYYNPNYAESRKTNFTKSLNNKQDKYYQIGDLIIANPAIADLTDRINRLSGGNREFKMPTDYLNMPEYEYSSHNNQKSTDEQEEKQRGESLERELNAHKQQEVQDLVEEVPQQIVEDIVEQVEPEPVPVPEPEPVEEVVVVEEPPKQSEIEPVAEPEPEPVIEPEPHVVVQEPEPVPEPEPVTEPIVETKPVALDESDKNAQNDKLNRITRTNYMQNKIDDTIREIVYHFVEKAPNRDELKQYVCVNLQSAIKDLINEEFKLDLDANYRHLEYNRLDLYEGPASSIDQQTSAHGEIIIKVPRKHTINVKANEDSDTVVSSIANGEIIVRNIDTSITLNTRRLLSGHEIEDSIDMNIIGKAYIKDFTGTLIVRQFKGIIVIKTTD